MADASSDFKIEVSEIKREKGTEKTLYISWKFDPVKGKKTHEKTEKFEVQWAYSATGVPKKGEPDGVFFQESVSEVQYGAQCISKYTPPDNAKRVRVRVRSKSKKDKKENYYYGTKSNEGSSPWWGRDPKKGTPVKSAWVKYVSTTGKNKGTELEIEAITVKGQYVVTEKKISFKADRVPALKATVFPCKSNEPETETHAWASSYDAQWEFEVKIGTDKNKKGIYAWQKGETYTHHPSEVNIEYQGVIPAGVNKVRLTTIPTSQHSGVVAEESSASRKFNKVAREIKDLKIIKVPRSDRQVYAYWGVNSKTQLSSFTYVFQSYNSSLKKWMNQSEGSVDAAYSTTIEGGKEVWSTTPYTVPEGYTKVQVTVASVGEDDSGYTEGTDSKDRSYTIDDRTVDTPTLSILTGTTRTVLAEWTMKKNLSTDIQSFEYYWNYKVYGDKDTTFRGNTGSVDFTAPWNCQYDAPVTASQVDFVIKPIPVAPSAFISKETSPVTKTFGDRPNKKVDSLKIEWPDEDRASRTLTAIWTLSNTSKVDGYEVKWRYTINSSIAKDGLIQTGETKTISDKNVKNDRYQIPENVKLAEVTVRPIPVEESDFVGLWSTYAKKEILILTRNIDDDSLTIEPVENTERTLKISFANTQSENVGGYDYEYESFNGDVWSEPTTGTTVRTAFTLDAPNDCKIFRIRVKPYDESGEEAYFKGDYCDWVSYEYDIETRSVEPGEITLALQRGSTTTVLATWEPELTDKVAGYSYIWRYCIDKEGKVWLGETEGTTSNETLSATFDAPALASIIAFKVRPDPDYSTSFTGEYTPTWVLFTMPFAFAPDTPSTPELSINKTNLTATLMCYDEKASSIEFEIITEDGKWEGGEADIDLSYNRAAYNATVAPGHNYWVRARAKNEDGDASDWSEWAGPVASIPAALDTPLEVYALSRNVVELDWEAQEGIEEYTIEYTTKTRYFDAAPDQVKSATVKNINRAEITELDSPDGTGEWFFRLKCKNDQGESEWSEIASIILGSDPDAPTTWSSANSAIVDEDVYLYWLHNSADSSLETAAILELTLNGYVYTLDIVEGVASVNPDATQPDPETAPIDISELIGPIPDADVENQAIRYYVLKANLLAAGALVRWKVKTKGVTENYGPWSAERQVIVYARPNVIVSLGEGAGWMDENFEYNDDNIYDQVDAMTPVVDDTLSTFPILVYIDSTPNTQTPVNYVVTIAADDTYDDFLDSGSPVKVMAGQLLYRSFIYTDKRSFMMLIDAKDVNLDSGRSYTMTVTVSMDSGLTAETTAQFTPYWDETNDVYFNLESNIRKYEAIAYLSPSCTDENDARIENVLLSIYRMDFDGKFTEIAKDLPNVAGITATDPHPALFNARYRILARSTETGQTYYYDSDPIELESPEIIIQWDEPWRSYDKESDANPNNEMVWSGSTLRLPFNVDESESNDVDVEMVNYIGRSHPVSYYGTHVGQTASWKTEIPKSDKKTIELLRRLAIWPGNAYVRAPSGIGYWAHVKVSFDITHLETSVPVSLDITRVEGGK